MKFVVVDTETTGMSPERGAELLEIGAVLIDDWKLNKDKAFCELIRPESHIPVFITSYTGISSELVRDKPRVEDVLRRFLVFAEDRVMVMHNAPFDLSFLNYFSVRCGFGPISNPYVDTITLSRSLFRGRHNLDILLARLAIMCDDRHRALGDALATAKAFIKMTERLGEERVRRFIVRR